MANDLDNRIFDHHRFVSILDCVVRLPYNNRELFKYLLETVATRMFAFQYSEGEHALMVRQEDWELVNELVQEATRAWKEEDEEERLRTSHRFGDQS